MGRTLQAQDQTGEIGLAKGRSRVRERRELPSQPTWMSAQRANIQALNSCEFSADGWHLKCVSSHFFNNYSSPGLSETNMVVRVAERD